MKYQQIISALLFFVAIKISDGQTLTIGKEAQKKCLELGKSCDKGSLCVIRHLQWPMNMSFPMCIAESQISGMLTKVKLRICQKPPEPGNCGARWVRWYFNTHIQKCSWFYFQGCNGNENNFRSKTECQAECMPNQQTNIIQKPIIYGLDGPMVVMQPMNNQPDYSNHISKGSFPSVRSKPINNQDRELRRKRRLERRRQKRLRKLMRKRRKSMRGRKRRREGKSKLKGKSRKKRKNKKKKKGKRGKKKKSKPKGEKTTIKIIPGEGDDIKNTKDLVDKLVAQETLKGKKKELKKDSKS